MRIFPGYDAHSPTLRPSPLYGDCMRGIIPSEFVTAWTDSAPPIFSGDFVRLWIAYPEGFEVIVKRLRVSRAGTWWGECADGVFPIGTLVQPFAIEKVVALDREPLVSGPFPSYRKADEATAAHYAREAEELGVTKEWATLGHVDGAPFPGLERVNYFMNDGRTRNPKYEAPRPL